MVTGEVVSKGSRSQVRASDSNSNANKRDCQISREVRAKAKGQRQNLHGATLTVAR